MCFVNDDYDWIAQLVEEEERPAAKDARCHECGRAIHAGQIIHYVFMQQYEECRRCFGDTFDGDPCPCGAPKDELGYCSGCRCAKPELGETFDYVRCVECDKFLQAVEAVELEAGCGLSEARPALGEMTTDISGVGREEARQYIKAGRRMFPELVASGYLGLIWRRMFG